MALSLVTACATLPENVGRKETFAYPDTGDTRLGREISGKKRRTLRESPVSTCWATAWTRSSPAPHWRKSPSAASTCSITFTTTISSAGY